MKHRTFILLIIAGILMVFGLSGGTDKETGTRSPTVGTANIDKASAPDSADKRAITQAEPIEPQQTSIQPSSAEPATGEEIKWQVISSGGTKGTSTNFVLNGTVGQTAVGYGSSANFGLSHGFWQEFGLPTCCNHDGIRGDVDYNMAINVGDVAYLVEYLFGVPPGPAPPCFEEGDVDASLSINVGDLAHLVAYLFDQPPGPPPAPCP